MRCPMQPDAPKYCDNIAGLTRSGEIRSLLGVQWCLRKRHMLLVRRMLGASQ